MRLLLERHVDSARSLVTRQLSRSAGRHRTASSACDPRRWRRSPHPDVSRVQARGPQAAIAPARARFDAQHRRHWRGAELGAAYGKLGLVYQAHQQQAAAASCFINAGQVSTTTNHRWPYHLAVLREETGAVRRGGRRISGQTLALERGLPACRHAAWFAASGSLARVARRANRA